MTREIRVTWRNAFAWQCPFSRRELAGILAAMGDVCGLEGISLELTLADDAGISRENAKHLGCPGPTNILSFPAFGDNGGAGGVASLLLSLDTLQRESLLYGQDHAEHALRLLAHGMAHLGGLDHGPAMDAVQEAAFAAGMAAAR